MAHETLATRLADTPANQARREQAQRAWDELLDEALRRGFFGTASLDVSVQDGTIQHVRRRVERVEK
jgi:hypothetical protein